jgi:hypothetical protein
MTRVEPDKYSVLIRSDYLYALGKLSRDRKERDELIQKAVESFLKDCTFDERAREIRREAPRMRISFPLDHEPTYHMYIEFIQLPDELVEHMDLLNRDPDTNVRSYRLLGHVLNAAIRVYLEKNHPEYVVDPPKKQHQLDVQTAS